MNFFSRLSPIRAFLDLRAYLQQRPPRELGFLALAIVVTGVLIVGLLKDSRIEKEYRPEIVYVKQWTLDRTDDQIKAQQKIDQVQIDKDKAEMDRLQAARQAEFKKLDDKLEKWGI